MEYKIVGVTKVQAALEKHYKLPFKEMIEEEHWKKGNSIASIARTIGVNPATIRHIMYCKGIRGRNHQEAADMRNQKAWSDFKKKHTKARPCYE